MISDWSKYPNFSKKELDCEHTGKNNMQPEFMDKLQELRSMYGKPIIITGGYRDPSHPIEAAKKSVGYHTKGIAADIGVWSDEAYHIAKLAFELGFTGIRVSQRAGKPRFIHLDMRPNSYHLGSY